MDESKNETNLKIYYIGQDSSFLNHLKDEFKKFHPELNNIDFLNDFAEKPEAIQSFVLKIFQKKPRVIIIDLSDYESEYLHLARVWSRLNYYQDIPIVTVCSSTQSKAIITQAIGSNLTAIHIKSQEMEAIVYHIINLAFPKSIKNHGFATAKMNDPINCYYPCKISLLSSDFIRVESNRNFTEQSIFKLVSYFEKKRIINSGLVKCVDQGTKNVYSDFEKYQVLQLAHADPLNLQFQDELTPEELEAKKLARQQSILDSRAKLDKWIQDNHEYSYPKNVKVLVVDKKNIFYDLKPNSSKYPFVLRSQPFLENPQVELNKFMPQIIIYHIENLDEETMKANADIAYTYNDSRSFQYLIKVIKALYGENLPTFVCFNSGSYTSDHLQKTFQYPNMLAVHEDLSYEMGTKVIQKLYNQIAPRFPAPKPNEMYLQKAADISYAELETDITLLGCSENDIYFSSDQELSIGEVLRVNLPIPMYVTITEKPDWTIIKSKYYGIIHGIGELERQALRRFINSVFFRDLDLAKAKDAEEVERLKQQYLESQQQQIRDKLAEIEKEKAKKDAEMEQKADNLLKDL